MMDAKQLKIILWERGMTQRVLAEATNIPESYVSMFINGKLIFSDEQWERINDVLEGKHQL